MNAGTAANQTLGLSSLGYHYFATANTFIESEELSGLVRFAGNHGKDSQVSATDRIKQRVT